MKKSKKVFQGQKDGEELIMIFRKHWFGIIKPICLFTLLFVVSVLILVYWFDITIMLIVGFVILLLAIFYFLYNYLLWWQDVYILTTQRVIDVDQKSLFHRVVSEAELKNIQDTNYEVEGFWRTMLNFGRVKILTASSGQSIVFEDISNPHKVQEMIIQAKDVLG